MILPVLLGLMLRRLTLGYRLGQGLTILVCVIAGIAASLGIFPLLYPLFVGLGSNVVIPELREEVIFLFSSQFPIFTEIHDFLTPPYLVVITLSAISLVAGLIGFKIGKTGSEKGELWTN
ncbi:MAG: hypothetical protein ACP6KW_09930 [Candidatus Thorarchaeota archaeon]